MYNSQLVKTCIRMSFVEFAKMINALVIICLVFFIAFYKEF